MEGMEEVVKYKFHIIPQHKMAHFSLINKDNQVIHVAVVDNVKIIDENGLEQESLGIIFLQEVYKGYNWPKSFDENGLPIDFYENMEGLFWKQTSYNARDGVGLRKNFAGKGYTYNLEMDAFIPPKPVDFPDDKIVVKGDWVLNDKTATWDYSGTLK
jgi:hypothetical protein